jgi:hypothetical protein
MYPAYNSHARWRGDNPPLASGRAGKRAVRLASASEIVVVPDGRLPGTLVARARYSLSSTSQFTLRCRVAERAELCADRIETPTTAEPNWGLRVASNLTNSISMAAGKL